MLQFKSRSDLDQLSPEEPDVRRLIGELIRRLIDEYIEEGYQYDPEADGWIVYVNNPSDQTRVLHEIWDDWTLLDIPWEGITKTDGYFQAVFLANNQFGLVFLIPDADWLTEEVREMIERHLDDDCEDQRILYEDLNQGESI